VDLIDLERGFLHLCRYESRYSYAYLSSFKS